MPSKVPVAKPKDTSMYISWADGKNTSIPIVGQSIMRSNASGYFRDIEPGLSVRDSLTRGDYEYFRPDEAIPTDARKMISTCMWAYKRISIVRNVVDLMADFACQGIEIVHPNKKIEKWLQNWAKKVRFVDRSERFLNLLYRAGNVVVQKSFAKLKIKDIRNIEKGIAQSDMEIQRPPEYRKNEIPWQYIINSPLAIEIAGGDELAAFAGKVNYQLRVNGKLISKIKNPKNLEERLLVQSIPDYIVKAVKAGKNIIPLDPSRVSVYHYKKDDWEGWADPIASAIIGDLKMLDKLKLADMSALDGAISHVRLWKLGNIEAKLYPTDAAIAKLADILASAVGGGAIDIIWGPDIDFKETSTDIYKFLGTEKYQPTLIAIYDGFGIPLALTGYAAKGSLANNSLSVKTLVERLNYGRNVLTEFWEGELRIIEKAMGFRDPASIRFSRMVLTDEAAEKALYIQLADRNLVSIETIQERFGEIPELELLRQRREEREIKSKKRLRRASQWHNPEHHEALEKIALQAGVITPGQLGMELDEKQDGEKSLMDLEEKKINTQEALKKQRGVPGQGRPVNSKDKQKRKQRVARATTISAIMWTRQAQDKIAKIVNPIFLQSKGKKTLRSLSDEDIQNLEELKYAVLCNLNMYCSFDENKVYDLLSREEALVIPPVIDKLYRKTAGIYIEKFGMEPSIDKIREIQASVYALCKGEIDG
jgi:hypothetical protein